MRIFSPVALIACVSIMSMPSVSAATSVSLIWTSVNASGGGAVASGNSVTLDPSAVATLTLDVQIDVDSRGLAAAFINFGWDTDLGNEANLPTWEEFSWFNASGTRKLRPLFDITGSTESTDLQSGTLTQLESVTLGYGPASTTLTFARLVFATNLGNIENDGNDIFSGTPGRLATVLGCNAPGCVLEDVSFFGADINVDDGLGPSLNIIPEPGTALPFGLGLGALAGARRRGRN